MQEALHRCQLDGKYFDLAVSEGQHIEAGELLLTCDLEKIRQAGYQTVTPVIVTNPDDFPAVSQTKNGEIRQGEPLIALK